MYDLHHVRVGRSACLDFGDELIGRGFGRFEVCHRLPFYLLSFQGRRILSRCQLRCEFCLCLGPRCSTFSRHL